MMLQMRMANGVLMGAMVGLYTGEAGKAVEGQRAARICGEGVGASSSTKHDDKRRTKVYSMLTVAVSVLC